MDAHFGSPLKQPFGRLLPWLVLIGCAGVSIFAGWLLWREAARVSATRFERQVDRLSLAIEDRFSTVSELLHGARALSAASQHVAVSEWRDYFRSLQGRFANGVLGMGYVERVARGDLPAFTQRMRADGESNFEVQQPGAGIQHGRARHRHRQRHDAAHGGGGGGGERRDGAVAAHPVELRGRRGGGVFVVFTGV
jgi:CHASE1-domain containing sensor protein